MHPSIHTQSIKSTTVLDPSLIFLYNFDFDDDAGAVDCGQNVAKSWGQGSGITVDRTQRRVNRKDWSNQADLLHNYYSARLVVTMMQTMIIFKKKKLRVEKRFWNNFGPFFFPIMVFHWAKMHCNDHSWTNTKIGKNFCDLSALWQRVSYHFSNFQGQSVKFASFPQNCFVGSNSKGQTCLLKTCFDRGEKIRNNLISFLQKGFQFWIHGLESFEEEEKGEKSESWWETRSKMANK